MEFSLQKLSTAVFSALALQVCCMQNVLLTSCTEKSTVYSIPHILHFLFFSSLNKTQDLDNKYHSKTRNKEMTKETPY